MVYCLKKERATIYEFKEDSVLYRPLKRMKTTVLADIAFRDLSTLRDRYEGRHNRLNQHSAMTPIPADDKVYRVAQAQASDLMRCEPNLPKREAAAPEIPDLDWRELQREQALERVLMHGEPVQLLGVFARGRRRC